MGATYIFAHFGVGKHCKYYNSSDIASVLGLGLPFFHAFTGCDIVSSFFKQGKGKFWNVWMEANSYDNILTNTFKLLSNMPTSISDSAVYTIAVYIQRVYFSKQRHAVPLDKQRMLHFINTPDISLKLIPPSRSGLLQHIKRSTIHAGWLWKLCDTNIEVPDPENWGWIKKDDALLPLWQEEETFVIQPVLKICSCKKGHCINCSCTKANLSCLQNCKCERDICTNK